MKNQSPIRPVLQVKETNRVPARLKLQKKLAETVITAQEAERKRLSQELHDNVNQLLATAKLFLDRLETRNEQHEEFKSKITQYIEMAFTEIRGLSHSLSAPHFEKHKLTDSLKKITSDITLAGTFAVYADFDEKAETLDLSKKMNLYRIFQEQIKNTMRYSRATNVETRLFVDDNHVHMLIQDNGVGFDINNKGIGSGLSNIFERAELCGGTATVTTSPGCGCKLEIVIPVLVESSVVDINATGTINFTVAAG